jgi:glutamate-1-semialdehyde 2,1-aminomutase/spore coat polysaccharide biosynthesis protein SpsF
MTALDATQRKEPRMNVAILQARMGSSRLRGKVLEDLGGASVLARVVARAKAIPGIGLVGVATPDTAENDAVAREATRVGAVVWRGPEHDVLGRYMGAAEAWGADIVMRLTCDCPFLDPSAAGDVLALFTAGGFDYASNIDPRTWPKGLDAEVFSIEALSMADAEATLLGDREHVTPFIRREPRFRRASTRCPAGEFGDWRWTLDYPEDLDFCRAVQQRAGSDLPGFAEIRAILAREPRLADLNAHLV